MSMPADLVMVRHGRSEANIVQSMRKNDPAAMAPEGFYARHDSEMRLAIEGVGQAEATGEWLRKEFPNGFDQYFVSPHIRTKETAGRLAIGGAWLEDDRWRERDWGEYGVLSEEEQMNRFELSHMLKSQQRWYWCPPGGESLATGVRLRFERTLNTLHRQASGLGVIAVTHGEMIDVANAVLQRMSPRDFLRYQNDSARKVSNCQVMHYTRHSPENGDDAGKLRWFRSVCPWDETRNWYGGEWQEIPPRPRQSDEELLAYVEQFPRLLAAEEQGSHT